MIPITSRLFPHDNISSCKEKNEKNSEILELFLLSVSNTCSIIYIGSPCECEICKSFQLVELQSYTGALICDILLESSDMQCNFKEMLRVVLVDGAAAVTGRADTED